MAAHVFQCPSCGAPITPNRGASIVNCDYCNAPVVVPEELQQASHTAKWATLIYDAFISNHNDWTVGNETGEYFAPLKRTITDGRYRWEAKTGTASSLITTWLTGYPVSDFHLTVNCKHIRGSKTGSSWGVVFRIRDNDHYYHFHATDSRLFTVSAKQDNQWLTIVDWTSTNAIKPNGVNQLEVIAYGKRFTFLINGQVVSELEDDRFKEGLVGLSLEGYVPGEEVTFDFMDITLRAP